MRMGLQDLDWAQLIRQQQQQQQGGETSPAAAAAGVSQHLVHAMHG
jgi:hypothetical protein